MSMNSLFSSLDCTSMSCELLMKVLDAKELAGVSSSGNQSIRMEKTYFHTTSLHS